MIEIELLKYSWSFDMDSRKKHKNNAHRMKTSENVSLEK